MNLAERLRQQETAELLTAAPAANLTVASANAEGTSNYFARSDHSHAITSSSNPGAAASILATDAGGNLTLAGTLTLSALGAGYVKSSAVGVLSVAAEVPLIDLGSYTQGDLIYGGAADWQDLAHPGAANRVLQSTAAEVGWSANAVTFPAAGATVVGTGGANQVAYWTGANTITGDAGMTYNAGTDSLTVGDCYVTDGGNVGIIGAELLTFNAAGTAVFSGCRVGIGRATAGGNLEVYTAAGSTSIYIDANTDNATLYIRSGLDAGGGEESHVIYADGAANKWAAYKTAGNEYHIYSYATTHTPFRIQADDDVILVQDGGNVGVRATAFGTNAVGVLGIANGTEPTTSPANMIQLFSMDIGGGGASLGVRTEEVVTAGAPTLSHKIKVKWNGVEYWLGLDAV